MALEVSIVTASLNYGAYIETCIQSVMVQRKWHDAKINHVIVDGGSTDNTHAILLKYKDDITCLVNKGEGLTSAFNSGLDLVEERFPDTTHIGFMNADDFYRSFWLDETYKQLRKEPSDVALVCADIILYGAPTIRTRWGTQRYFDKMIFGKTGNVVAFPSVLIRFSALKALKKKYGFCFNPDFAVSQDIELWYRLLDSGYRIRHIPQLVACFRVHSRQLSQTKFIEQCRERDIVVEWCCRDVGISLPSWWGDRWVKPTKIVEKVELES